MTDALAMARLSVQASQSKKDASKSPSDRRIDSDVTEDAIAREFKQRFKGRFRWCADNGVWFKWDGSIWQKDRTNWAFDAARDLSREIAALLDAKCQMKAGKASFVAAVERFARSDRDLVVTIDAWDQDSFLLGTPHGTVDLRTGQLRPSRPADGITKSTAIAPDESVGYPTWLRFLHEVAGGNAELVQFLQRWVGYTLTGDTREHALVFIYGDGGNGKSVFLNVLNGILATYATVASMDTITVSHGDRHSTDLAMLRGARLVTATETEEGKPWAESRIKQLTGGDQITARFMRQDNFTFRPAFKLTIAGNHKPVLRNIDDAARRRLNMVPFTQKPRTPDLQLEDKLKAEWPGILKWAIEGCLQWQALGLQRPSIVSEATREYFADQDVMAHWLSERCRVDVGNDTLKATSQSLFSSWAGFAKERQEEVGTMRSFTLRLQHYGPALLKNVTAENGSRSRGFSGIILVSDIKTGTKGVRR